MEVTRFSNYTLSQLMLGTVQFGLNYGIANKVGQPSYETARDIIACAHDGGVTCLDTAAIYGSSEEVLGKALAELGIADEMVVATKVCHMADGLTASEADSVVEESVTRSLRRLRLDFIPICLFHTEENFFGYSESLLKLRDRGLVGNVGSSVNTPDAAERIVGSGSVDAVQLPTSILDQRFVRRGICEEATGQSAALFARSIYLQGLLFVPEDEALPELREAIPVRRRLQLLANEAGIGLAELAVRYVLSVPGITSLVVGVDSVDQMSENIELFERGALESDLLKAVCQVVPDLPESVLFPGNWSKRMTIAGEGM